MKFPRITIVTPSFNQGDFLEETIRSVLEQNYPDLEYFVMDGGSTDQSVAILKKYEHVLSGWVSEPDGGQAAAINKGLERATGDYVAFINSDDVLKPGALQEVAKIAATTNADWICGAVHIFGNLHDYGIRLPNPSRNIADWLVYRAQIPQQGSFWKNSVVKKVGVMHTDLSYAFDLEYWIRLIAAGFYPTICTKTLAGFRIHEITKSMGGRSPFLKEHIQIAEMYADAMPAYDRERVRQEIGKMMAETHIYEAAQLSEQGRHPKAHELLRKAVDLYPPVLFKRYFWGAVRKSF